MHFVYMLSLCMISVVQCLRCGVQFLGNAVAGFEESKIIVWQAIFNIIRFVTAF